VVVALPRPIVWLHLRFRSTTSSSYRAGTLLLVDQA